MNIIKISWVMDMNLGKRKRTFFCLFLFCLIVGVILFQYFSEDKNKSKEAIVMVDLTNKLVQEAEEYAKSHHLFLQLEYQYHYDIEKDHIISQNIDSGVFIKEGVKLQLVVSKGQVPDEVYSKFGVNELGRVPIMMYHGIIPIENEDTEYIGGNVDKDGYNRTVEAFREDLEFYYKSGYRMIRLQDYIDGNIEVELGYSPLILTFDDGNENNFKVLGESNGELIIDPDCAVGVLEEFKKKYPDYGVTATFFLNSSLFGQEQYNDKILKWLVEHGYDIGNHTMNHVDFTEIGIEDTNREVGGVYSLLDNIIPGKYVSIVALPFGSPYQKTHDNYSAIIDSNYYGKLYHTIGALRVGWEASVSCFDIDFDPLFLKRIRAYDNGGMEFDIEMNFKLLESNRFVSDGDKDTIVILQDDLGKVGKTDKRVISYSRD